MISLNQLVTSGKVLYLGISDTPAWIVSRANQCECRIAEATILG
jgi:aryl-alcohol dehydrogenase-like predicted oxidoreductase